MFIDQSMTKDVITVGPQTAILEAKAKMAEYHVHHLPVVEADETLVGIVTDRDIRSALPSGVLTAEEKIREEGRLAQLQVKDIMTENPITISPANTLEDALLMMQETPVGAFPVVGQGNKLQGIVSKSDLLRAFINVLGIREPGTLLCILVEEKLGQMKKIVDAISEERISFGSILVARYWEEGKRAVFPYLLTNNVVHVKKKLQNMGFEVLNPMKWYLDQLPKTAD